MQKIRRFSNTYIHSVIISLCLRLLGVSEVDMLLKRRFSLREVLSHAILHPLLFKPQ